MEPFVAVLMGGSSSERSVSLSSGNACAEGLMAAGYRVARVDVCDDTAEKLLQIRPNVVFNALHGRGGEDGVVQGLLESLAIPYTHSGVMASAIAMNKVTAKHVVAAHGVPVAESVTISSKDATVSHVMTPPYVLKPIADGSSCGIQFVQAGDDPPQMDPTLDGSTKLMAERYISGRELTCAVLDGNALGITEILTKDSTWYDFNAKYNLGGSTHVCPAELPADLRDRILEYSEIAHRAIGCRGVTRSDFRFDPVTGELIFLEINTQPGMTPTSLLPEIASHKGISFEKLVSWMIDDASLDR